MVTNALGIYEKALPRGLSWEQTFDHQPKRPET